MTIQQLVHQTGELLEDRNGERHLAIKVDVTYTWTAADGSTLTRTYTENDITWDADESTTEDDLVQSPRDSLEGCFFRNRIPSEKGRQFDALWKSPKEYQ